MNVDYNHSGNIHTLAGARNALPVLIGSQQILSLLDVGCGTGTWLRAALDFGIVDVIGLDGVNINSDLLHVPAAKVRRQDLACPWHLNRQFDVVICLEVAEHLDSKSALVLIEALTNHGDRIVFSAACPNQDGQHHVNCQWPAYWQQLFNSHGFACYDDVRWDLWEMDEVEPWYRQNVFTARRAPQLAGNEPRIPPVIHPKMMPYLHSGSAARQLSEHLEEIQKGCMPTRWYLDVSVQALWAKLKRRLK